VDRSCLLSGVGCRKRKHSQKTQPFSFHDNDTQMYAHCPVRSVLLSLSLTIKRSYATPFDSSVAGYCVFFFTLFQFTGLYMPLLRVYSSYGYCRYYYRCHFIEPNFFLRCGPSGQGVVVGEEWTNGREKNYQLVLPRPVKGGGRRGPGSESWHT